ncbi:MULTISPECIES: hypothetical protein [Nostocales]|nr:MULTISPECIES: hypothetical protein [Nostocales]
MHYVYIFSSVQIRQYLKFTIQGKERSLLLISASDRLYLTD